MSGYPRRANSCLTARARIEAGHVHDLRAEDHLVVAARGAAVYRAGVVLGVRVRRGAPVPERARAGGGHVARAVRVVASVPRRPRQPVGRLAEGPEVVVRDVAHNRRASRSRWPHSSRDLRHRDPHRQVVGILQIKLTGVRKQALPQLRCPLHDLHVRNVSISDGREDD